MTFKWSRDNASVVAAVKELQAQGDIVTLEVDQTGRDSELRFKNGDWIEITDDFHEFAGEPGHMRKIAEVDPTTRTIKVSENHDENLLDEFPAATIQSRHTRIRRWDQKSGVLNVPLGETPVVLEDGIQVTFSTEPAGGRFHVGDYWVFAARTADRSVETLDHAPPRGIHHHYGWLALITPKASPSDCRVLWPSTYLWYVGGDGQEAAGEKELCGPLEVRLVNGHDAVSKVPVTFRILAGSDGHLIRTNPDRSTTEGAEIQVETDANGLATCRWRLAADPECQRVEAFAAGLEQMPLHFNARRRSETEEPGIRVQDVRLRGTDATLRNDGVVTFEQLKGGIDVVATGEIDGRS